MAKRKAKAAPATEPRGKTSGKRAPRSKPANKHASVDVTHPTDVVQQHHDETPQMIFLTDLPLELLSMIFDYAAPNIYGRTKWGYPLICQKQIGARRALVAYQPSMLFVCSSLRLALLPYFYSTSAFYTVVDMRLKGSRNVNDVLTVRRFQERLPCRLSTIKLTFRLRSSWRHHRLNWSAFTEMGLILFEEYRVENCKSERGNVLAAPRWQLEFIGGTFYQDSAKPQLNEDLATLLSGIHSQVLKSALDPAKTVHTFSVQLEKWLMGDQDTEDPTYRIRSTLRRCMGASRQSIATSLGSVYGGY